MEQQGEPTVAIIGSRGYPSYYGGFETAVRHLVPALADHGWKVVVYGRSDSGPQPNDADPRAEVVVTRGLNTRSLSTLTFGFTACLNVARRRPDVALVMNVANGYWLPILRMRGVPTVVNVDGLEWERDKWSRLAKLVFRVGAWLTAKTAHALVFDAKAIGDYWREHFGVDGTFIPYGADEPAADSDAPMGLRSRAYVLLVARFVPENTVEAFFEAADRIAVRAPIVIVGSSGHEGEYDLRAAQLAERHEGVSYLGHVADDHLLASLWRHAGAYFHGHSVGGTNPALVQAMACGAPIVARDTVFNREVLAEAGVFVAPESDAIVEAIVDLLGRPPEQQRLSELATMRARTHYSWLRVCSAYEALLTGTRST